MNRIHFPAYANFIPVLFTSLFGVGVFTACDVKRDDNVLPPVKSYMPSVGRTAHAATLEDGARWRPAMALAQADVARAAPPARPGAMSGKPISADDVDFVEKAGRAGALEVEASKVALEKSKTPAVRTFARKLMEDHSQTSAELRALAISSSVANVTVLSPKDGEQLRRLQELEGRDFDREYVAQIGVAAHEQTVGAFQKAAESATDTQLKAFAQQKLPALREHLKTAQSLAQELGPPAKSKRALPATTGSAK